MALKSSSIAAVLSSLTVGVVASWAPSLWAQAAPAPAPAAAPAAAPTTPAAAPTTAPATKGTGSLPGGQPDLGEKGAFVIDQVSGFRGRIGGGVGYYGPVGVAYNTFTGVSGIAVDRTGTSVTTISQNERTIRSWSVWLAPSIDYFLVDNLSIGGLFSIETTFGSQTTKVKQILTGTSSESESDLPTVVSFTLMPRIGYLIRTSDRLSIWPRIGVGYFNGRNGAVETSTDAAGKTTSQTVTTSISSMLFQLDLGIIYQVTDNVFFRVAPSVSFSTNEIGRAHV